MTLLSLVPVFTMTSLLASKNDLDEYDIKKPAAYAFILITLLALWMRDAWYSLLIYSLFMLITYFSDHVRILQIVGALVSFGLAAVGFSLPLFQPFDTFFIVLLSFVWLFAYTGSSGGGGDYNFLVTAAAVLGLDFSWFMLAFLLMYLVQKGVDLYQRMRKQKANGFLHWMYGLYFALSGTQKEVQVVEIDGKTALPLLPVMTAALLLSYLPALIANPVFFAYLAYGLSWLAAALFVAFLRKERREVHVPEES